MHKLNKWYVCMFSLSVAFLLVICIRNCISFDLLKYHDTSQIVITLSLLPIAVYVSMIQHRLAFVEYTILKYSLKVT